MADVVFRTQGRGYAKEDVTQYINQMDKEMQQLRSDLQASQNKAQAASRQNSEKDTKIAELLQQMSEQQEQNAFLTDSVNRMGEQINESKAQAGSQQQRADELAQTVAQSEQQIAQLQKQNRELTEQMAKSDENSRQIGEVIIEAHRMAGEIVANAEERARTITLNAQLVVAKLAEDIGHFQFELDAMRRAILENTEQMNARLDAMYGAVEDAQRTFTDRFSKGANA